MAYSLCFIYTLVSRSIEVRLSQYNSEFITANIKLMLHCDMCSMYLRLSKNYDSIVHYFRINLWLWFWKALLIYAWYNSLLWWLKMQDQGLPWHKHCTVTCTIEQLVKTMMFSFHVSSLYTCTAFIKAFKPHRTLKWNVWSVVLSTILININFPKSLFVFHKW